MRRTSLVCIATIFTLLLAPSVFAQDSAEAAPAADAEVDASQGHMTAVTISPIHLEIPLVELTAEHQIAPQMGAALIVGLGKATDKDGWGTLWELGGQFRYYALGDFNHGLQLGAEFAYTDISLSETSEDVTVSATGGGTSFGGFVGYKFAADFGLTVDIQFGYFVMMLAAKAEASVAGKTVEAKESETSKGALLNINLGWSF